MDGQLSGSFCLGMRLDSFLRRTVPPSNNANSPSPHVDVKSSITLKNLQGEKAKNLYFWQHYFQGNENSGDKHEIVSSSSPNLDRFSSPKSYCTLVIVLGIGWPNCGDSRWTRRCRCTRRFALCPVGIPLEEPNIENQLHHHHHDHHHHRWRHQRDGHISDAIPPSENQNQKLSDPLYTNREEYHTALSEFETTPEDLRTSTRYYEDEFSPEYISTPKRTIQQDYQRPIPRTRLRTTPRRLDLTTGVAIVPRRIDSRETLERLRSAAQRPTPISESTVAPETYRLRRTRATQYPGDYGRQYPRMVRVTPCGKCLRKTKTPNVE
ncbi:hypothetical protein DBV15_07799, partial [Temnothorax longispinosus]